MSSAARGVTRPYDPIGPDTDRLEALFALAMLRAKKEGSAFTGIVTGVGPADEYLPFAFRRLGPAFRAADMGHTVTWDPPAVLTSIGVRWTCTRCGRAVLSPVYETEHAYGSALTEKCRKPEYVDDLPF